MSKVLVISVHPDDETLGCGGTILKHKRLGDEIYWLILTNIDAAHGWDTIQVERRQREIEKVFGLYGFNQRFKLDFPAVKLDTIPYSELVGRISQIFYEISPNVVYVPNRSDIHTDHQIAFRAIMSCTKQFRFPFINRILMYECLSETEFAPALTENTFVPNVFIDVSEFWQQKLEIMKIYDSELMDALYPRSLEVMENLARFRGSRIGKRYAEAFTLLFEMS